MDRQRRKILELGLGGLGIIGGAIACSPIKFSEPQDKSDKKIVIPPMKLSDASQQRIKTSGLNPIAALREFYYGKVSQENGRTVREF